MRTEKVLVGGKSFDAFERKMGAKKLIFICAQKGFIMCGYLNKEAAENFGDCACVVSGVDSIEAMLDTTVAWVSPEARKLGIRIEMPVKEVLLTLS